MLNEVSPELVGKVNKARLHKPAKSAAARETLRKAVKKTWLNSKVGTIKEAVKAAGKHDKGPFAIATKTRGGGLRRVPDTRFDTWDSANKYGLQYHTDRYGAQMFVVIQHPDAKKKIHEDLGGGTVKEARNDGFDLVSPGHWKHKNGSIHWENDRTNRKGVGTYRVMRGDNLSSKDPKRYRSLEAAKKALAEDMGGGPGSPTTGGIANVAGDATSTANVHWSKRQPNIGMKGPKKKYGQPMMFKAMMRRKMTGEQTVFYKALGKRVKAVSRTSAMGGGSDGSSGNGGGGGGNGGESVQREHIVRSGSQYKLVSKKTGKNLGTYPTRAGAEKRERQVQYFKHKG